MKVQDIVTEDTSAAARARQIYQQIQNLFTDLQDELYDVDTDRTNPDNARTARQALDALEQNDFRAVHQLMRRLR